MLVCVCDKKTILMHFDLYYVCSSVIYHERSLMQVLAEVNKKSTKRTTSKKNRNILCSARVLIIYSKLNDNKKAERLPVLYVCCLSAVRGTLCVYDTNIVVGCVLNNSRYACFFLPFVVVVLVDFIACGAILVNCCVYFPSFWQQVQHEKAPFMCMYKHSISNFSCAYMKRVQKTPSKWINHVVSKFSSLLPHILFLCLSRP